MDKNISPIRKKIFAGLACALILLILELALQFLFPRAFPNLYQVRSAMLGRGFFSENTQNVSPHPYLNYELYPGFENEFGLQHNMQGFRGAPVPLEKDKNTFRILALGESTTYGMYIPNADETHPALLEAILNKNPPVSGMRVEVINAGVPSSTSAEALMHYHFKYSFFQPDLVLIDLGANDSVSLEFPFYHPDYSNWRSSLRKFETMKPIGRALFHSHLFSFLYLSLQFGLNPPENGIIKTDSLPPLANWWKKPLRNPQDISDEEWGYQNNLEALIELIQAKKSSILLVPLRYNPINNYSPNLRSTIVRSENVMKKLSKKYNVPLAEYPEGTISPQNFVDNCHFNSLGALQKARYLAPIVSDVMKKRVGRK